MKRPLQQGALRAYATARPARPRPSIPFYIQHQFRHQSSLPNVAQASFWKSLIPKSFRPRPKSAINWGTPETKLVKAKGQKSKEWNPATFYIIIFLFIGSMSIQMIALKRDFSTFTRRAEVRIELLREVIEKIQRGEEVDVKKVLGTGDAEKELEWEEALREIERDGVVKNSKKATTKAKAPSSPTPAATESEPESMSIQGTKQTAPKAGYSSFF
ncbi:putative cell division protein [Rosellinia necatrix]|uniref:Putative cell division protein n=1 Tax=Rosellinia necatrix TaxID=77044 RepID=A0A1W2TMV5_ROSNE|nr:putative cell division protein [Rosellinia necatrix]